MAVQGIGATASPRLSRLVGRLSIELLREPVRPLEMGPSLLA